MTDDERRMALAIHPQNVVYLPGIGTKRFAFDIAAIAIQPVAEITERQAVYLRAVVHRYRRQIPREIVTLLEVGK